MGAVLMEVEDGSVKVGLRCRPPYDVSEVAVELGGGGHPLASGCTLPGPLAEAEATLVHTCKEAIDRQTLRPLTASRCLMTSLHLTCSRDASWLWMVPADRQTAGVHLP